MYLKKYSQWIVVTGTLLIWCIKFLIRPFISIPSQFNILLGIAPNLLGSFMLPFFAHWFLKRFISLQTKYELTVACLFGLLLVIINEYIQRIPFFGRTFDYLDILSSVIGVMMGHLVFGKLMGSRQSGVSEVNW